MILYWEGQSVYWRIEITFKIGLLNLRDGMEKRMKFRANP